MEFELILPVLTVVFSIISLVLGSRNLSSKKSYLKNRERLDKEIMATEAKLKEIKIFAYEDFLENKEAFEEAFNEEELEEFIKTLKKTSELKAKLDSYINTSELKSKVNSFDNTSSVSKKESGKIDKAVITYIVPAIAALALVGLYIFLWVTHGDNPDYSTPEALNSIMSVVVGYLFGATAASNT